MTTTTHPKQHHSEAEGGHSFDPTQGQQIGSSPYDDATQGQQIGSNPYDDPTRPR